MATYRLLRKLAAGGMAEVFLGKVVGGGGFEKPVAIKRILSHLAQDSAFIDQFLAEARLTVSLQHANVVQVFDLGRTEQTWSMVLEYIDGENLRAMFRSSVRQQRPFALHEACHLMLSVAEGLAYAHQQVDAHGRPLNVIHRDVTPSNVLIAKNGEVKLADFGIAKAASSSSHTQAGTVRGKSGYMSPEQLGGGTVDQRSDVFNLGIVLYELVLGQRLFREVDLYKYFVELQAFRPANLELGGLPPELRALLLRSLSPDPGERFENARGFADALSAFLFQQRLRVTGQDIAALFEQLFAGRRSPLELPAELQEELILSEVASSRPSGLRPRPVDQPMGFEAELHAPKSSAHPAGPRRKMRAFEVRLVSLLAERKLLSDDALKTVSERYDSADESVSFSEVLVTSRLVAEADLLPVQSAALKVKYLGDKRLREAPPPTSILDRFPKEKAERLCAVPVALGATNQLFVAMKDPTNLQAIDEVRFICGMSGVVPLLATESGIRRTILRFYDGVPDPEEKWVEVVGTHQSSLRTIDPLYEAVEGHHGLSLSPSTPPDARPVVVPAAPEPWTTPATGVRAVHSQLEQRLTARQLEVLLNTLDGSGGASAACQLAGHVAQAVAPHAAGEVRSLARTLYIASLTEHRTQPAPPSAAVVRHQLGPLWDEASPHLEACLAGGFLTAQPKTIVGECLVAALGLFWVCGSPAPRGEAARAGLSELVQRARLSDAVLNALSEATSGWLGASTVGKAVVLAMSAGPDANQVQLRLMQDGWKVVIARSAGALAQAVRTAAAAVVDTDVLLPDPVAATRALRSFVAELALFVLTAEADERLVESIIDAGAVDVLSRPVNPALLASKLRRAVAPHPQTP